MAFILNLRITSKRVLFLYKQDATNEKNIAENYREHTNAEKKTQKLYRNRGK